jgi:hypothetical protein
MDKGKIAEGLLALVMDPVRAASVSGDLLEAGASRTGFWFWSNVLQTVLATIWREVKAWPIFVLGLAIRGALVQSAIAYFVALPIVAVTISHQRMAHAHPFLWYPLLAMALGSVNLLVAPFFAGRWVARCSLGKEFAVCIAMTLVAPFVIAGISFPFVWVVSLVSGQVYPRNVFLWLRWWELGFLLPYLTGALLVRRRRQLTTAT